MEIENKKIVKGNIKLAQTSAGSKAMKNTGNENVIKKVLVLDGGAG
ncbi:hypothetical protein NBE98_10875 [Clostridium swellfunianum]|nr:hypothetical protein [Clostridium swellfunianum]